MNNPACLPEPAPRLGPSPVAPPAAAQEALRSRGPLPPHERDVFLDALRGFALFGILVVNLPTWSYTVEGHQRSEDVWPGVANAWALAVARVAFSGKFNALFSMLFGIGFVLQLERMQGAEGARVFLRRLGALALFGVLHFLLVWHGDVLFLYARLGVVLLLLRNASTRAVLALAVGVQVVATVISLSYSTVFAAERAQAFAWKARWIVAHHQAVTAGTYVDAVAVRWAYFVREMTTPWSYTLDLSLLSTALLGVVVGRHRLWRRIPREPARFLPVLGASALVGVVSSLGWNMLRSRVPPAEPTPLRAVMSALYDVQRPAFLIAYAIAFLLLAARWQLAGAVRSLAFAGRMALTNYLLQSLIGTWIFHVWGLGLYGKLSPAAGYAYAVVFFGAQVCGSRLYLRHASLGPMERLWRRLTYGRARHGSGVLVAPGSSTAP